MHTIELRPFHHRSKEVIGMYFIYDALINNKIRQIPDVSWSNTHHCWYMLCTRQSYKTVRDALRPIAVLNTAALQTYLTQKKALVADTNKPLRKSTATLINQFPLSTNNLEAIKAYRDMLILKNYSKETMGNYCNAFHHLLRLLGVRNVSDLSKDHLQSYLLWLTEKKHFSASYLHTAVNAIKFYFEKVLGHDRELYNLPRPKKPQLLPDILAEEELAAMFLGVLN